jgi:phenylalanyl-tRNA synthetase beta chain
VRLVCSWLGELVPGVPADAGTIAREIGLRGFEVAGIEHGRDPVIDLEITANRPDCLSHLGLAREASAIWGLPIQMPDMAASDSAGISGSGKWDPGSDRVRALDVAIDATDLCPRYCAQVFHVKIGPSPAWLQERLEAAGVRPINNIVDVTNYVMLEIGQPMHAFDLDRIALGRLVIRRAVPGERMRTLDGIDRTLDPDTLLIADAERALAIGGVMGGQNSEISQTTTTIALESAYFQPASIRRTSKRLGLKTEASSRFERSGDVKAPPAGILRAAALFQRLGAAAPAGPLIDRYPAPRQPLQVRLRASRIGRLLGQEVPADEVPRFLEPLGFTVVQANGPERAWTVTVPTFRVDVTREVDLIEEVGRHHGFDRLPVRFPPLVAPPAPPDAGITRDRLVRHALTSAGFSESMTFAFIERLAALPFCEPGAEPAAIANPLSEKFAVLRPSLLPGLVDSCAHNRRRGRRDIQLFEVGSRFTSKGEGRSVAFAWTGAAAGPHWSSVSRTVDFFDAKGTVELLCGVFGMRALDLAPSGLEYLVRGRAADVRSGDVLLGIVGELSPQIAEARGLTASEDLYVAEIDMDALARVAASDDLRAETLPRYPSIVRDVSILIDEALPAASVRGTIRAAAPPSLAAIAEFDRYQGKGVPEGRVSLSLRLTFRDPERTLTDDEAQAATERIVDALRTAHGAEQR